METFFVVKLGLEKFSVSISGCRRGDDAVNVGGGIGELVELFRKLVSHALDFNVTGSIHVVSWETNNHDRDKIGVPEEICFVNKKLLIGDEEECRLVDEALEKWFVVDFKEDIFRVGNSDSGFTG